MLAKTKSTDLDCLSIRVKGCLGWSFGVKEELFGLVVRCKGTKNRKQINWFLLWLSGICTKSKSEKFASLSIANKLVLVYVVTAQVHY